MATVLPNSILTKMSAKDRATLGRAGMTAEEAEAAYVAKNEADLQKQIIAMLNRNGIHVICSRTGKRTTTAAGTPDLLFSVNGASVAWELKVKGNKPSKEQIDTMRDMAANGWKCSVLYSYDDALAKYRELSTL